MAAANPHRTAVSATNVDLPMVARAVCQNRVAHVSVQIATQARVAPAGPRLRAPRASGALLYLRHEGVVKLEPHSRLKQKGSSSKTFSVKLWPPIAIPELHSLIPQPGSEPNALRAAKTSILVKFIQDRLDLSRTEGTSLAA